MLLWALDGGNEYQLNVIAKYWQETKTGDSATIQQFTPFNNLSDSSPPDEQLQ